LDRCRRKEVCGELLWGEGIVKKVSDEGILGVIKYPGKLYITLESLVSVYRVWGVVKER
jgi:hypothetical protein